MDPDELLDDYGVKALTRIYADDRREQWFRMPGDVWDALRAAAASFEA